MSTTRAALTIDGRGAGAEIGATVFDTAEAIGVRVPTSCYKQGKCRECLVEIEDGGEFLSPRTPEEEHLPEGFRLSCRARFERAGEVACHTMRRGELEIVEDSEGLGCQSKELAPRWQRVFRSARPPVAGVRNRCDAEGVATAFPPPLSLDTPATGGRALRKSALLRDGEEVGEIAGPPLGLAVDLGTTTVVLQLGDLESGRVLATHSFENPQRFGGSDVMARIRYDGEHRGRLLQRVLFGYLRRAVETLPCDPGSIVEMVVAGNTTMRDLFFGLDVQPIGQLPYRSTTEHELGRGERKTTSLEVAARNLRLPLHPAARVYGLPLVSSHVGADAAACLLATGLAEREEVAMVMDVGTNSEVFIGNRERILAASCPAGPAFEGGGVDCGMPALPGAVERVVISDLADGCKLDLGVIGNGPPTGVCGSGLVDLLSELRRTGRMSTRGRFTGDEPAAFAIDRDRGILLTEADVNELAQAKGANAAGLRLVADRFGIALERIDRFYLAGGFGRHLDVDAARRIGLIPDLPDDRIVQVGNAALGGAALALRSVAARSRLEELVRRVEHVPLETQPGFFDAFVDGCQFEPFPASPREQDRALRRKGLTANEPTEATGEIGP